MNKGFPEALSWFISLNELCYWKEDEVDAVFGLLRATAEEIKDPKLQSFSVRLSAVEEAAGLGIPTSLSRHGRMLRLQLPFAAPFALIERANSALTRLAGMQRFRMCGRKAWDPIGRTAAFTEA